MLYNDEPHVDDSIRVIDPNNNSILVTRDIEDSSAILEDAGAPNVSLDVCRCRPIRASDLSEPCHYRFTRVDTGGSPIQKRFEGAERDHSHKKQFTIVPNRDQGLNLSCKLRWSVQSCFSAVCVTARLPNRMMVATGMMKASATAQIKSGPSSA